MASLPDSTEPSRVLYVLPPEMPAKSPSDISTIVLLPLGELTYRKIVSARIRAGSTFVEPLGHVLRRNLVAAALALSSAGKGYSLGACRSVLSLKQIR